MWQPALSLVCTLLGTYLGGFFGSISQLTWFTEGATFLVSIGKILAAHDLVDTPIYNYCGGALIFVFFACRVFLYNYMIFWKMQDMCLYRFESFWVLYPQNQHMLCYLYILTYFVMYCMQLHHFSTMIWQSFRVLGIDKAIEATERIQPHKVGKKEKDD